MQLTPVTEKFILHWGEMGTKWGINRTVAQIHALLFLSPKPLNAEEIAETLTIARSNVSTSLKELQNWGIVRVVHVMGDRRDHFETLKDVWELFHIIMNERKRREFDPTIGVLKDCVADAKRGSAEDKQTQERLGEMLDFMETMSAAYEQLRGLPTPALVKLVKTADKIKKVMGVA